MKTNHSLLVNSNPSFSEMEYFTKHDWRMNLRPEVKDKIRRLQTIDYGRNLRIPLFFLIWTVAGFVSLEVDVLFIQLACYFFAGATIHGLGILMHEGVHHTMFRNKSLNRWVSFVCGIPALMSVSSYRVGHLPHHKFERGELDPDELENISKNPRVLAALFCLTFLFGDFFGYYRVGPFNALRTNPTDRRAILQEYGIIVCLVSLVLWLVPLTVILHVWVFPVLFGRMLTNVRTLSEHILTSKDNLLTPTRTVVSNGFVSFFMCNLNYHVEHHLFPAVPHYNLPEVHVLLLHEFEKHNVQVFRSYTQFLMELGHYILKAWSPGGNQLDLCLPVKPNIASSKR
jgi:fatty acid desaturase